MHCVSRGAHTRKAATLWPHPALPLPPQLAAAPADLPHLQDVCTRRSGPRGTRPPISCLPIAAPLVPAQAVGLPQCSIVLLTRAATATAATAATATSAAVQLAAAGPRTVGPTGADGPDGRGRCRAARWRRACACPPAGNTPSPPGAPRSTAFSPTPLIFSSSHGRH